MVEEEPDNAVDAVASYFNCTVESAVDPTQDLVAINVTASANGEWVEEEEMDMDMDMMDMDDDDGWTEVVCSAFQLFGNVLFEPLSTADCISSFHCVRVCVCVCMCVCGAVI